MFKQAGESAYFIEKYSEAAEFFVKAEDYMRTIDCLEQNQEWEKILDTIHIFKEKMDLKIREGFLSKFMPLYLDNLLKQVDNLE